MMDFTNVRYVRKVLAANFGLLIENAHNYRKSPRKISITAQHSRENACLSQANFAFQIGAIEAQQYCDIRDRTMKVTDAIKELRNVNDSDNYLCGQVAAIARQQAELKTAIANLSTVLNLMVSASVTKPTLTTA